MTIFQTIVLGIVEGVTEFLPVSSTGHMVLASHLLGVVQTSFVKSFEIIIQLGAIAAVAVSYWRKLLTEREINKRILIAFIPTGLLGFLFYSFVKQYLLGSREVTVLALFVGGVLMIVFERWFLRKPRTDNPHVLSLNDLSYPRCFALGMIQAIAMIPGVSRSASTILGGMAIGLSRVEATEFSFLVATPTLLAASGLDLVKSGFSFSAQEWMLLGLGFLVAFFSATVAISWFMRYLRSHTLTAFGVYRILVAIVFWFL